MTDDRTIWSELASLWSDWMARLERARKRSGVIDVLWVAIPAAMGMINVTIMQVVDRWMVARLIGPRALAAAFVAGILCWVPISLISGTTSVVNTFVSQNLGAGRRRRCGQYAWHGLYVALAGGLMLALLAPLARSIFQAIADHNAGRGGAVTSAEELRFQREYFQVMVCGGVFRLLAGALERYFFGTHRALIVWMMTLVAMGLNISLNFVLITGWGPFPKLGMAGAALGTVLAWVAEFAIMLCVFLRRAEHRRFATWTTWRLRLKRVWDIIRVGLPAGLNWFIDLGCWSYFNAFLVGYFGEVHRAASSAAVQYMHISFMPAVGMSVACSAVVGKRIGEGRPDLARRRAHTAVKITAVYMGLCGLVYFIFRYPLIELYVGGANPGQFTPAQVAECVRLGTWVLLLAALFQCFDAMGITFIGALRGAGDTFWPMVILLTMNVGIMIGGGTLMRIYAPGLTSIGPWIAASVYVIMFGLVMAWRFESGAWRKIDLLGRRPIGPPVPAEPVAGVAAMPDPAEFAEDKQESQTAAEKNHER